MMKVTGRILPFFAQTVMINPQSRNAKNLNGNWSVIIDPTEIGEWRKVWLEKKTEKRLIFSSIHLKEDHP